MTDDPADALRQIAAWAEAYDGLDEVTDPITDEQLEKARDALAGVGVSIGALHARWARVLVEDIGRLAREGLEAADGRRTTH